MPVWISSASAEEISSAWGRAGQLQAEEEERRQRAGAPVNWVDLWRRMVDEKGDAEGGRYVKLKVMEMFHMTASQAVDFLRQQGVPI